MSNFSPPNLRISLGGVLDYNSTFSTSATKRPTSSARKAATTLKTASLRPPTFRMSLRSGACVVGYAIGRSSSRWREVRGRLPLASRQARGTQTKLLFRAQSPLFCPRALDVVVC